MCVFTGTHLRAPRVLFQSYTCVCSTWYTWGTHMRTREHTHMCRREHTHVYCSDLCARRNTDTHEYLPDNKHVLSWNTNTCLVGTHFKCVHVNTRLCTRGTHICVHVNTHTRACGADPHARVHLITHMCSPETQTRVQLERTCVRVEQTCVHLITNICSPGTHARVQLKRTCVHT